ISGVQRGTVSLTSTGIGLWSSPTTGPRLTMSTSAGTEFVDAAGSYVTVKGADAVGDDDFVTKRQVDLLLPSITEGYGMDISGNWQTGWGFAVDTDILDTRYLRKDVNDDNDTFTLTLGGLNTETAIVQSTLT